MDARKKLCTSCKLILPGEFRYCPMCGEPVTDRAAPAHALPYEPPLEDENPLLVERLGGALTGRRLIIIGVVVAVLLVIAGAVVLSQRPQSTPIAVASATPTPSPSPTPTPFVPTPTPFVPTPTPFVPTATPFPTATPLPTATPTSTPTATPTSTPTATPIIIRRG
jgi:hypothetical protein